MNSYLASFGPVLANHLWQSTAFGLLAWLLTLALRRNQARVRYAVWLAASIKFLVPFSLLVSVGHLLPHPTQPLAPVVYSAMDVVEEPFAMDIQPVAAPPVHVPTVRERVEAALPVVLGTLWLLGFGTVLFAWGNRWRVVARSVRQAVPATDGRELEILQRLGGGGLPLLMSAERMEPGVFGVFRPVLVWPAQLSVELDDHHVEAIVAHELTHVRRRDNLTALLHMLAEAAFWFHPLVWWIERQMVKEREQACDEAVVAMGGSAESYAESLLKTCWFCIESPLTCVSGVTGADLKRRVAGIISARALMRMTWQKKMLVALAAVSVFVAPVVLGQAKAAEQLMRAAIHVAPKSVQQIAAHTISPEDVTVATGETSEVSPSSAQESLANGADSGLAFEVATVRPTPENDGRRWFGFRLDPSGRLTVSAVPLTGLVGFSNIANPVNGSIAGGPAWAESQKWDITAEADTSTITSWNQLSDEERMYRIKPMLRKLVTERFHLKVHTETRTYDVYAMVPSKRGVKLGGALKRADPPPAHRDPQDLDARLRSDKPVTGPPASGYRSGPDGIWWFRSVRTNFLAMQLAADCRIEGRVVDQTGLEGYYDLTFKPDRDPDAPSLQAQVEMEIGLRFEPKKVSLPTYVIDSAEKPSLDGAPDTTPASAPAHEPDHPTKHFEVVSIRPSDPNSQEPEEAGWDGNRYYRRGEPLSGVVATAFYDPGKVPPGFVASLPQWVREEKFDITAKVSASDYEALQRETHESHPDVPLAIRHQMLQNMLAERCNIAVHPTKAITREYSLQVGERGINSKRLKVSNPESIPSGAASFGGAWKSTFTESQDGSNPARTFYNMTMAEFARHTSSAAAVHDDTGLSGRYDFTVELIYRGQDVTERYLVSPLGLKWKTTDVVSDAVVVDHIDRPSLN